MRGRGQREGSEGGTRGTGERERREGGRDKRKGRIKIIATRQLYILLQSGEQPRK